MVRFFFLAIEPIPGGMRAGLLSARLLASGKAGAPKWRRLSGGPEFQFLYPAGRKVAQVARLTNACMAYVKKVSSSPPECVTHVSRAQHAGRGLAIVQQHSNGASMLLKIVAYAMSKQQHHLTSRDLSWSQGRSEDWAERQLSLSAAWRAALSGTAASQWTVTLSP